MVARIDFPFSEQFVKVKNDFVEEKWSRSIRSKCIIQINWKQAWVALIFYSSMICTDDSVALFIHIDDRGRGKIDSTWFSLTPSQTPTTSFCRFSHSFLFDLVSFSFFRISLAFLFLFSFSSVFPFLENLRFQFLSGRRIKEPILSFISFLLF